VITTAAKLAGIHRSTHHDWVVTDDEYRDCVQALGDVALDFVESQLHTNIRAGKEASAIFYMKTKGKKRGYIESVHNINQTFDDNNVIFLMPHNGRDEIPNAQIVTE
jgi:hypothetical protein